MAERALFLRGQSRTASVQRQLIGGRGTLHGLLHIYRQTMDIGNLIPIFLKPKVISNWVCKSPNIANMQNIGKL